MLAAEFEYHCAMGGAERPAYVPVVASGRVYLLAELAKLIERK